MDLRIISANQLHVGIDWSVGYLEIQCEGGVLGVYFIGYISIRGKARTKATFTCRALITVMNSTSSIWKGVVIRGQSSWCLSGVFTEWGSKKDICSHIG